MSEEIIKDSGEYYRSYDKSTDTWTRHYFWNLAKLVILESGETVQHAIDNVSSKVLSIISQDSSATSTTTAPSSKVFHDTIQAMRANFQDGCEKIANAISSRKTGKSHTNVSVDGVPTPGNSTPETMANNIEALAAKCIDAGYAFGTSDTSATDSDLFKAGRDWADNRVNTTSASYRDGYSKGQTAGANSVKKANKLTLTATQTGNNIDIADNWYTTADASAVYKAGQDSVKKTNKLTLTANQTGTSVDITDGWYTSCDASAVYNAGKTAGRKDWFKISGSTGVGKSTYEFLQANISLSTGLGHSVQLISTSMRPAPHSESFDKTLDGMRVFGTVGVDRSTYTYGYHTISIQYNGGPVKVVSSGNLYTGGAGVGTVLIGDTKISD